MNTDTAILCPLAASASRDGAAIALQAADQRVTYQALDGAVTRLAAKLASLGLRSGQRLLVQSAPKAEHIALMFACWRRGVTFVPMSPRLPESQRQELAAMTGASVWLGHSARPPQGTKSLAPWEELFPVDWLEATKEGALDATEAPMIAAKAEATALLTSGSTHRPKAALHWFQNHYYNALGSNQNIALAQGDVWLLSLPMFHVAGIAIVMRCVIAGATIALPKANRELIDHLLHHQPSHLSLVTTQLSRLLEMGQQGLEVLQQCKAILLGGSAIPRGLLAKAAKARLPIFTSYGSTEMASQITTTRPDDDLSAWSSSAGTLLPYREIKCSPGHEIMVRGKTRFAGYLTEAGRQQPFDDEGWFATGDLGELRQRDGQDAPILIVKGRKDSMFISGGENIQPEEIERALEQHQDIERAIVVDVPSSEFGSRPCAFVKMKSERRLQSKELRKYLKQHVASFKIPDRFFHWPQEPPESGIKISRASLRKIAHRA